MSLPLQKSAISLFYYWNVQGWVVDARFSQNPSIQVGGHSIPDNLCAFLPHEVTAELNDNLDTGWNNAVTLRPL